MRRRDFVKGVGALSLASSSLSFVAEKRKKKLVVLHTNDQHSRIDPFPMNHPQYPGMGGFTRADASSRGPVGIQRTPCQNPVGSGP